MRLDMGEVRIVGAVPAVDYTKTVVVQTATAYSSLERSDDTTGDPIAGTASWICSHVIAFFVNND